MFNSAFIKRYFDIKEYIHSAMRFIKIIINSHLHKKNNEKQ